VHVVVASGEKCILSAPPHIQLRTDEEACVYTDPEKLHLFQSDGTALNGSGGSLKAEGLGDDCAVNRQAIPKLRLKLPPN
jgi:hypothetical protein